MNSTIRLFLSSIIFLISLLTSFQSEAQDISRLGRFSVVNADGCAPLTVNVTEIISLGTTRQYWYENRDNPPELTTTHVYNTPGEYYLVQLNNDTGGASKQDSLKITVREPTPPEFEIFNCGGHMIRVEILDRNYDSYRVDFTNTDSEIVTTSLSPFTSQFDYGTAGDYPISVTGLFNGAADNCGVQSGLVTTIDQIVSPRINTIDVNNESTNGSAFLTFTIGENSKYILEVSENGSVAFSDLMVVTGANENVLGLNTRDNFYCFRLKTFACDNTFIESEVVCTTGLDVTVDNGFNTVSWTTDQTLAGLYRIIRDGTILTELTDTSIQTYNDTDILCGVEYGYEVQTFFNSASSTSVDTLVLAEKTGDLPALGNPSSTIVGESVVVTWPEAGPDVPLSNYILQRSTGGRSFNSINFTFETEYTDPQTFFRQDISYRVLYDDQCGNRSLPSPVTNPIILNITDVNSSTVNFEWTKYETWVNGIRTYFLERLDDSGNLIEEFSVLSGRTQSITFSILDDQPKNIRVRAESLDAVPLTSFSNVRTIEVNPVLHLPKAFTPDGDELNDSFEAKGPRVFNFKMQIFSRWGDTIFFSEDVSKGWDGLIGGSKAPEGIYVYKISFEDATNRAFDQSGTVVLLRKK